MFNYSALRCPLFYFASVFFLVWVSIFVALLMRVRNGYRRRGAIRLSTAEKEQRGADVPVSLRRGGKAILRRAVVVVGGDFARSPRMQYHARSLMKCGLFDEVVLVGFDMGNRLIEDLRLASDSEAGVTCRVETRYLITPVAPPEWFVFVFRHRGLCWTMSTLSTVCVHAVLFTWFLMRASFMVVNGSGQLLLTDLFLVQLPPAIPFVPVLRYIARPCVFVANLLLYYGFILPASWLMRDAFREIREGVKLQQKVGGAGRKKRDTSPRSVLCPALVVDWHNFGYTIMQCEHRPFLAVCLYRWLECGFCFGDRNVTVSKAMRRAILKVGPGEMETDDKRRRTAANDVAVLYDNPPSFFGPVPRHRFVQEVLLPAVQKIGENSEEVMGLSPPPAWVMQTEAHHDAYSSKDFKGLFMVAATSWTVDDDYTMVVDALVRIDKRLQQLQEEAPSNTAVKRIWLLVTGKGVSRERFERTVTEAKLSPLVTVTTVYFQRYAHYAMALGAADVGLCLHHSSSGLDLPMKAVDMLGSGLPVVALRCLAIDELLDDRRGWLFADSKGLENIIWQNLVLRPETDSEKDSLEEKQRYVRNNLGEKWDDKWNSVLLPLLKDLL